MQRHYNNNGRIEKFLCKKGVEPSSIIVAPDGIDLADFVNKFDKVSVRKELGLPLDKKIALYIGRLDGWKGAEILLAASKLLPRISRSLLSEANHKRYLVSKNYINKPFF